MEPIFRTYITHEKWEVMILYRGLSGSAVDIKNLQNILNKSSAVEKERCEWEIDILELSFWPRLEGDRNIFWPHSVREGRFESSGVWRWVVGREVRDVSKMKALRSSETVVAARSVSLVHIPDGLGIERSCCQDLQSGTIQERLVLLNDCDVN